jgi:hypothetical protein
VGVEEPPPPARPRKRRRPEPPRDREPAREPLRGLSTPAKVFASAFVAVLYAVGMTLNGDLLPGLVGGALAGVVCFLVLREIEQQRRDRRGG